jgi:hypothetical protein
VVVEQGAVTRGAGPVTNVACHTFPVLEDPNRKNEAQCDSRKSEDHEWLILALRLLLSQTRQVLLQLAVADVAVACIQTRSFWRVGVDHHTCLRW